MLGLFFSSFGVLNQEVISSSQKTVSTPCINNRASDARPRALVCHQGELRAPTRPDSACWPARGRHTPPWTAAGWMGFDKSCTWNTYDAAVNGGQNQEIPAKVLLLSDFYHVAFLCIEKTIAIIFLPNKTKGFIIIRFLTSQPLFSFICKRGKGRARVMSEAWPRSPYSLVRARCLERPRASRAQNRCSLRPGTTRQLSIPGH